MLLWVDKYRPRTLEELDHDPDLTRRLLKFSGQPDIQHLLFCGPPGVGKRTRLAAFLRRVYGEEIENVSIGKRVIETPSKTKVEVSVVSTQFHIEVSPVDAGVHDIVVIREIIKEMAQTGSVSANGRALYKAIVINDVDCLTKNAQHALRRTMERYVSGIRLFLICNNVWRIIGPLQSRCIILKMVSPPSEGIGRILQKISEAEGFSLPTRIMERIILYSEGNLRRAILSLELTKKKHTHLELVDLVERPDWDLFIADTAKLMIGEQTPKRVMEIRTRLYDLIVRCIPPTFIIKRLCFELIEGVDETVGPQIAQGAALYESRIEDGLKAIFHLEAFVIHFMAVYNKFLIHRK